MNREQKRAVKRKAESRGIDGHMVDVFIGLQKVKKSTETIMDGDKVRIDVSSIKNHPDYDRLSGLYKEFVESIRTMCLQPLWITALGSMAIFLH